MAGSEKPTARSTSTAFNEVRLDTLKEGRFLETAETDFRRLIQRMIRYADDHHGQSEGAKGRLTIELEVEVTKGAGFSIAAVTKMKVPGRPAMVAWPVRGKGDLGNPTLFAPPEMETTNPQPANEAPELSEG